MKLASATPSSRTTKLVAVMNILRDQKKPVTAAALSGMLDVSERTIYRYIAELCAQGVPVHGEAGIGYVLRPGVFLPPLMLTDHEAEALLLGLRLAELRSRGKLAAVVGRTLAKIEAILSGSSKDVFRNPAILVASDETALAAMDLAPFVEAIRGQSRLAIEVARVVEPFVGVVCPLAVQVTVAGAALVVWDEGGQTFESFDLDQILTMETLHDRYPHNRSSLLQALASRKRL